MKPKSKSFLDIGNLYVDKYLSGSISEYSIANTTVIRECLYECYLSLIKTKALIPIESMNTDEKNELWNECKKYCESLSAIDRIRFVKAYAALSCLIKKRV